MPTTRVINLNASSAGAVYSIISICAGDDVTLAFTLVTGDDATAWTIEFAFATTLGGSAVGSPLSTLSTGPGTFTFLFASDLSSMIPIARYAWQARRVDLGAQASLAYGWLDVIQNVVPITA